MSIEELATQRPRSSRRLIGKGARCRCKDCFDASFFYCLPVPSLHKRPCRASRHSAFTGRKILSISSAGRVAGARCDPPQSAGARGRAGVEGQWRVYHLSPGVNRDQRFNRATAWNGVTVPASYLVENSLRLGTTYLCAPGRTVDLSFGLGLTPDTPNLQFSWGSPSACRSGTRRESCRPIETR